LEDALYSELSRMLILAIVQGITEFLPVSSSGHLVIGGALLGQRNSGENVLFETAVHAGTLGAVIVYYRRRLAELCRSFGSWIGTRSLSQNRTGEDIVYIGFIIIGSIPAAVVGVALRGPLTSAFGSPVLASVCLLVTGCYLLLSRGKAGNVKLGWKSAVLIGIAQAIAILPGCSRSGWTITTAMICGLGFSSAAEFSFLLSIPAILGAVILESISAGSSLSGSETVALAAAAAVSFASGYAALRLLVWILGRGKFHRFSWYLIPAGAVAVLWFSLHG
jgi:undecaprenyl-diphosphatase